MSVLSLTHLPGLGPDRLMWPKQIDFSFIRAHRDEPPQGWREEPSADIVEVFSWIRDICSLPPVPSEWRKICSFCADRDLDDQPSASYCLPVGDVSADILAGIDDHIFSSSFGMQPKKVS